MMQRMSLDLAGELNIAQASDDKLASVKILMFISMIPTVRACDAELDMGRPVAEQPVTHVLV